MTDWDPIQAYLIEFARRLPDHGRRANRALQEVEDHLREEESELCRQGLEPADATVAAIERFGSSSEILRQFELQAPLESEVPTMVRSTLTPIAALTTVFAAMFFIFAWIDDAPPAETIAKVLLAVVVIAYNAILLLHLWMHRPARAWMPWLVFGGGIVLIAIGSAGFVWTAHLGLTTGDWESYGFVVAALLVLEGALATVFVNVGESKAHQRAA